MKNTALLLPIILTFCFNIHGNAQVLRIDLNKEFSNRPVVDLYGVSREKGKAKLSSFSQLKLHEINLNWPLCIKLAPEVFNEQKAVRGWIGLLWLNCLAQQNKKKSNPGAVSQAFAALEKHQALFHSGPWAQKLQQSYIHLRLLALENDVSKKHKSAAKNLDQLLNGNLDLTADHKTKIYQLLGDLALSQTKKEEAQFLYEQAQTYKDSKYLQDKLETLTKNKDKNSKANSNQNSDLFGEEIKIEERVRQLVKQNDKLAALTETMVLLNQYPGSRVAKRLKDKPLEIYQSFDDTAAKQKALDIIETDGQRLLDWAKNLHRRGDYVGSLVLAKKMVDKNPISSQLPSALWVAGRSSHFLGQYDRALDYFGRLIKFNNGSEEAAEALFRSALIRFRKKEFTKSIELLEKLSAQKMDRYDLSAQYWMVRSFQELNSERAKTLAKDLIEKYPFSYYGLILSSESKEGKLFWPKTENDAPKLEQVLYLVGSQKQSWQRFKILSDAGWVTEAQAELSDRPFIKSAKLKLGLAQKLSERHQYMLAIRLINEALESDASLRQGQFIKMGYPDAYSALYRSESDRYRVPVSLLKSLTRQESAFNLNAVSSSNAMGLMQMIPPTAEEISKKLGLNIEIPYDMFRPQVNIPMGTYYVAKMLEQFQGNIPFALAAYNAGPYRLKTWIEARPEIKDLVAQNNGSIQNDIWFDELPWSETSFYVKAILRNMLLYRLVEEGPFTLKPVLGSDHVKKSE